MYRFLEHTAELGLEIEAASLERLLEEATHAFSELVASESGGIPARHSLELRPVDSQTLLADWLNELVFLAETEDFVPQRIEKIERLGDRFRIELAGIEGMPRPLVKAVTYHELELHQNENGVWKGKVIFDV